MTNRLIQKGKIGLDRMIENQPIDRFTTLAARRSTPAPLVSAGARSAAPAPRGAPGAEDCLPLPVRPFGHFGMPEARP